MWVYDKRRVKPILHRGLWASSIAELSIKPELIKLSIITLTLGLGSDKRSVAICCIHKQSFGMRLLLFRFLY